MDILTGSIIAGGGEKDSCMIIFAVCRTEIPLPGIEITHFFHFISNGILQPLAGQLAGSDTSLSPRVFRNKLLVFFELLRGFFIVLIHHEHFSISQINDRILVILADGFLVPKLSFACFPGNAVTFSNPEYNLSSFCFILDFIVCVLVQVNSLKIFTCLESGISPEVF